MASTDSPDADLGATDADPPPGLPLEGIRVLDVGTRISAPFCAGLLGELGADVIKVELPGGGDFMRTIGPFVESDETEAGYSLFWAVEGRGRRSVTCDLRKPEGQALFRRLAATADVVCENFRPGTMEEWGLGPDSLDPRLVFVRISIFGQDGPYSRRPGLDRLGIAYGGLLHLTGERDRPPVRPGVTISDYLTGVFAAMAAVAGLYQRDIGRAGSPGSSGTGIGSVIDAPLYGAVLRVLEWTLAGYDKLGVVRSREGNRLPNSAPLDNYPTADGAFVCIVAGSDANFRRLCQAMDRPDLITDDRFSTLARRAARGDEINGIVEAWTSGLTASAVEATCIAHDVPVGIAYTAAEIFTDPHMVAREDLVPVEDPVIGTIRQQAPFPRFVGRPTPTPTGAPRLGAHNDEVWTDLVGVTAEELEQLRDTGVV
ncbi:MAG TPA: CaiB/BaiF CoA-transferase family protein [Acidimicrobiales bacterium]|nr:CaiB/BaiF CoA-transferase family protein [Acidimicrobiales bacterium]